MTELPTAGGSYVRDKNGRLIRQDDEAASPPPPTEPIPEPLPKGGK